MLAGIALGSHALGALLFAALTLWAARQPPARVPRVPLIAALGLSALWALTAAGVGVERAVTQLAEGARTIAWLLVILALWRRSGGAPKLATQGGLVGAVALGTLASLGYAVANEALGGVGALATGQLALRSMVALAALLVVHNLHAGLGRRGMEARLTVLVVAIMWLVDLNLALLSFLFPRAMEMLAAARGVVLVASAPVLALTIARPTERRLQMSPGAVMQALSLAAVALYLLMMTVLVGLVGALGDGDRVRLAQTALVVGASAALLALLGSPWLRAWTKVTVAKHLFRHRYDYRAEWVRFTATLGQPGGDAAPLAERIVKAVADLTDSPAGLLMVAEEEGLVVADRWNWPLDELPGDGGTKALAVHLAGTGRVIELDKVRAGESPAEDMVATPAAWIAPSLAWVVVPLHHLSELTGAILLARPPMDRALDWEDFDLLKIAGRQVASYLAEAKAQELLADGRRFDEFNRRFAFILHDVKNLVSQLTVTARNAERHADNPAFRADMVATLRESAERMNELLARLSSRTPAPTQPAMPVDLLAVARRIVRERGRFHPMTATGAVGTLALADAARLEQLLRHLVQNACEASAPDAAVTLEVGGDGNEAWVAVADRGCGMSRAFVRDQLFRPFASSKADGFGLGAHEARALAQGMRGRLQVESQEGRGSTFRVLLPVAAMAEEAA